MEIAIALTVLACCGGFLWWFKRNENNKKLSADEDEERAKAAKATAQDFINAKDLGSKCLYTTDGNIFAAVKIEGLSIELFSFAEQEVIKNNISRRLSEIHYPYKYIAVSRPVDISRVLQEDDKLKSEAEGGRKKLLAMEMDDLSEMVMSGETLERQYYFVIWESVKHEDERMIVQRATDFAKIFTESKVKADVIDSKGFVRLCNLVNIPAYAHIEDMNIEDRIAVLKAS